MKRRLVLGSVMATATAACVAPPPDPSDPTTTTTTSTTIPGDCPPPFSVIDGGAPGTVFGDGTDG